MPGPDLSLDFRDFPAAALDSCRGSSLALLRDFIKGLARGFQNCCLATEIHKPPANDIHVPGVNLHQGGNTILTVTCD